MDCILYREPRIVAPAALALANYGATNIIFILHLLNNFAAMFQ